VLPQVPNARTIVSKVGTIQSKFRVYDMKVLHYATLCLSESEDKLLLQILAGDSDTVAEVRQQDCRFQLDVRQVSSSSQFAPRSG
jgi:hypothetical protein